MPQEEVKISKNVGSKTIIRLIIFLLIIYLSFSYFSQNLQKEEKLFDPTVLGEEIDASNTPQLKSIFDNLYNSLPENSRQQIEHIDQSAVIIYIQEKYTELTDQLNGFPDRQMNQIKKDTIQKVY